MTLTASPRRVATQETTQPADRRPPDSTTFAAHKHRARRQRQERQTVETGRNQGPRRAAPGSLLRHTQDVAPAFPTRPRATAVTDLSSSRDELQERAGERGRPPRRDWRCGSGGQPARCGPRGLRRSRLPLRHCADGRQLAGLRCYRRSSRLFRKGGSVRGVEHNFGMPQNFIESRREQGFLLPPDVRDWLAAGSFGVVRDRRRRGHGLVGFLCRVSGRWSWSGCV